jgi:hypothetical protein
VAILVIRLVNVRLFDKTILFHKFQLLALQARAEPTLFAENKTMQVLALASMTILAILMKDADLNAF